MKNRPFSSIFRVSSFQKKNILIERIVAKSFIVSVHFFQMGEIDNDV